MRRTDPLGLPVEPPQPPRPPDLPPPIVPDGLNLGREKLPEWGPDIWERIDRATVDEIDRASVVAQFLPRVPSLTPSARTVPANRIDEDATSGELSVDQGRVLPLLEKSQVFVLSKEQYYDEQWIGTGVALATRAANRLARQIDLAVLQGDGNNPGLVSVADEQHVVPVPPIDDKAPGIYGENLFSAVADAYAFLQGRSLNGPYALLLAGPQFADAHRSLKSTLIAPADRIRPLMTAGFHAAGTLNDREGVMVSLGGTVDLAIAVHGATAFTFVDSSETRRFRIYERFSVRIKVPESLVRLRFG
ncbi:bacteriocin family protein [Actinoplanes hulinensis]|uniref:Bacteriocin family protein n=1 Tax=Actinoplanes hulinensis TaxID=1144547 RepID=A0ABS7BGW8_9ACTN|nr:family 1 encapsulin nanocompartment shell protein [Actinoplanes hulinensis]MBW6440121.1 bacteriocin family protein [Actinoplanes hulinensis]